MFEVDVKNVTEEEGRGGGEGRRGPARVLGSESELLMTSKDRADSCLLIQMTLNWGLLIQMALDVGLLI